MIGRNPPGAIPTAFELVSSQVLYCRCCCRVPVRARLFTQINLGENPWIFASELPMNTLVECWVPFSLSLQNHFLVLAAQGLQLKHSCTTLRHHAKGSLHWARKGSACEEPFDPKTSEDGMGMFVAWMEHGHARAFGGHTTFRRNYRRNAKAGAPPQRDTFCFPAVSQW